MNFYLKDNEEPRLREDVSILEGLGYTRVYSHGVANLVVVNIHNLVKLLKETSFESTLENAEKIALHSCKASNDETIEDHCRENLVYENYMLLKNSNKFIYTNFHFKKKEELQKFRSEL